tara:strand:+ start:528 stop:1037 length:510 start_codon:yes stop_codon:yes gene_type:complete
LYDVIINSLREYAISGGAPSLLLIAFVDSAGLPTGGAPDFVLIFLLSMDPYFTTGIILVAAVTFGSLAGCVVLYNLGRKGGDMAFKHITLEKRIRIRNQIDRYGALAIVAAVMGPPPCPTKVFILSAGAFGMRFSILFVSVLMGRLLRYGIGGYLAITYGPSALNLFQL